PSIAPQSITHNKIANGAVTTPKIADGSVTVAKLATGVIPSSLPPSGTAGGDLAGNFPNPSVAKIQGFSINSVSPSTGQVLKYDGTKWTPSTDNTGSITFPFTTSVNSSSSALTLTNQGSGSAIE